MKADNEPTEEDDTAPGSESNGEGSFGSPALSRKEDAVHVPEAASTADGVRLVSSDNEDTITFTQASRVPFTSEQEQGSTLEATLLLRSVAAAAAINRASTPTEQLGSVLIPAMLPSYNWAKVPPIRGQRGPPPQFDRSGRSLGYRDLHAIDREFNGNNTNDVFYGGGRFRLTITTDSQDNGPTQAASVNAAIVKVSALEAVLETGETNTIEEETVEPRPETLSASSTPPPAYQSVEDLTSPPPFEAARPLHFTHHSTASSAQLPGITLLPQEPRTPSQVFDEAPPRSCRPRHEVHTLVDGPENKVVRNSIPSRDEEKQKKTPAEKYQQQKQQHINGGPRAVLSRLGLGLAAKASKKTTPRPLRPVKQAKDISWASLMRRAGHKRQGPTATEEGTTTQDTALEVQAKKSSWTYRAWKKWKRVVKAKQ